MRSLILFGWVLAMVSCGNTEKHVKEYGIGVQNDGTLEIRAITVRVNGHEYSYGGVGPGDFALHVGGLFLEEGREYPPIEFEYGLMKEYPKERKITIKWDGAPIPHGFEPPGAYPALMIIVYPGVEDKNAKIVWRE